MAGIKCTQHGCGMAAPVPDKDLRVLMMDSATITCPKCGTKQPAEFAFKAYEEMDALLRHGPPKIFTFGPVGIEGPRQSIILPGG